MHRLYALQQRLAITSPEVSALLFISGLLFVGFVVRHQQGQSVPFSPDYYAELSEAFAERTETVRASATPSGSESGKTAESGQVAAVAEGQLVEAQPAEARPRPRRAVGAGPVRMNLNTASEQTLQRLPGVGPKIAARIVDYRAAHGGFRESREVMRVKGIGPKTFEKLAPYLFVEEAGGEE